MNNQYKNEYGDYYYCTESEEEDHQCEICDRGDCPYGCHPHPDKDNFDYDSAGEYLPLGRGNHVDENSMRKFRVFKPIILASAKSKFETMEEMQRSLDEEARKQKIAEEEEEKRWKKVLDGLPKFSAGFLAKKKKQEEEESKVALKQWRETQKRIKMHQKNERKEKNAKGRAGGFSRRNGGGKKRSHAEVTVEQVKARRAAVRSKKKAQKKKEEKFAEMVEEEEDDVKVKSIVLTEEDLTEDDHIIANHTITDDDDYSAVLLPKKKKRQKQEKWQTMQSTKKKKDITTLVFGAKSYREVNRSDGYSKLKDFRAQQGSLEKTRMCNSVANGTRCPHGSRCRFAHSISELKIPTCFFGHRCRMVYFKDGKCFNKGGRKMCCRIHPGESAQDVRVRTNRCPAVPKKKVVVPKKKVVKKKVVVPTKKKVIDLNAPMTWSQIVAKEEYEKMVKIEKEKIASEEKARKEKIASDRIAHLKKIVHCEKEKQDCGMTIFKMEKFRLEKEIVRCEEAKQECGKLREKIKKKKVEEEIVKCEEAKQECGKALIDYRPSLFLESNASNLIKTLYCVLSTDNFFKKWRSLTITVN